MHQHWRVPSIRSAAAPAGWHRPDLFAHTLVGTMVEWFGVIDGYRYDFALLCGFAITGLIALRQLLRSTTRETAL